MVTVTLKAEYRELAEGAFAAALADYGRAAEQGGARASDYRIAGRIVRILFAGELPADELTAPLAPRRVVDNYEPHLVIHCWEALDQLTAVKRLVKFQVTHGWNTSKVDRADSIKLRNSSDRTLSGFNRATGEALWWMPDRRQIPVWTYASPFPQIFNWWLAEEGRAMIHAGAVGDEHGALLLVGKGGSGKSTMALAALQQGMSYLGDDYCAIAAEPEPTVYNLYGTGKLKAASLDLLPDYGNAIVRSFQTDHQFKNIVDLSAMSSADIPASRRLRAVVLPVVKRQPHTNVRRISPGLALAALAPSSIMQLPGAEAFKMQVLTQIVQRLPCFALEVGQEMAQISQALSHILDRKSVSLRE